MQSVLKLKAYLEGKKTYLIAASAVADGAYRFFVQHGLSRQSLFNYLVVGGGFAALRAAITKK